MAFFKNIKTKLENTLHDLTTIEHALLVENEESQCIYRFEQLDNDSICYISENPVDEEYIPLFNDAFEAASESRSSLSKFIIECLT